MNPSIFNETAVSLAGLGRERSSRAWMSWAADAGFRGIVMDAAAPDVRPRDLSRSDRRELASLLRRLELRFLGLDLWIPSEHFRSPAHVDRAMASTEAALRCASEIATLNGDGPAVVSLTLPEGMPNEALGQLVSIAADANVVIADHHWPARTVGAHSDQSLRVGFDPAAVMLGGDEVTTSLPALRGRLGVVRLTDADASSRRSVGAGRLELSEFQMALMSVDWRAPVVVDVRGLASPAEQAVVALDRWTRPR